MEISRITVWQKDLPLREPYWLSGGRLRFDKLDSTLVRVGDGDTVWFLNQHHLTTDAWSTSVIYRQTAALYALAGDDRLDEAESLPAYVDYVDFEEKKRDSRIARSARDYWRPRLEAGLLPSSFYRPTPPDRRGRTERTPCALC